MSAVVASPTPLGGDFVVRQPAEPLRDRVRVVWASKVAKPAHDERILPDGSTILLLNFAGQVRAEHRYGEAQLGDGMLATSASAWAKLYYPDVAHEQLGVIFAPGAAAAWFPEVRAASASPIPLHDLGSPLRALWDEVAHAPSLSSRVLAAEAWLLARRPTAPAPRITPAVLRLWSTQITSSVADIADRAGWTPQHLNRLLRQESGAAAKALQQVVRLDRLRRALRHQPDLAALAHQHGFADQSHLHRFVRDHTGLSVAELRAGPAMTVGRVHYEPR